MTPKEIVQKVIINTKAHLIIIIAMGCITLLELFALYKGIDGALLMSSLALIGGLGGYELKDMQNKLQAIKGV